MTETEPARGPVLIAVPTAQGTCTAGCLHSVEGAVTALAMAGRAHRLAVFSYYDIVTARNHAAAIALAEGYGHLLFIDSDMHVERAVFARLIEARRPVAGGLYTRRGLDLEAYARARAEGHAPGPARALASSFILRANAARVPREGDMVALEGIGMGATLIATELLRTIAAGGGLARRAPVAALARPGIEAVDDFFGEIVLEDGTALSEDFAFCHRANAAVANAVWGYAGPGIRHQGQFDYGADFADRLTAAAGPAAGPVGARTAAATAPRAANGHDDPAG
ncbi:MAG: hypothetical protein AAFR52_01040 [Pseudomonadota bacterium]